MSTVFLLLGGSKQENKSKQERGKRETTLILDFQSSFAEIARLLSEFFRDLDVVPSDVLAGLLLLRQRQQAARQLIISQVRITSETLNCLLALHWLQQEPKEWGCLCVFLVFLSIWWMQMLMISCLRTVKILLDSFLIQWNICLNLEFQKEILNQSWRLITVGAMLCRVSLFLIFFCIPLSEPIYIKSQLCLLLSVSQAKTIRNNLHKILRKEFFCFF